MESLFLVVTNRCTRRCPFCFYSTGYLAYPREELETEKMLDCIGRVAQMGTRTIILTGGEPLLRSDIVEIVRGAGARGLERLLLTNGELLDERLAGALLSDAIEGIAVSINSLEEAGRLERSLLLLQKAPSVRLTVTIVFSGENVAELRDLYRWSLERADGIIMQPAFVPPESKRAGELSPRMFGRDEWAIVSDVLGDWAARFGTLSYLRYVLGLYGGGGARPGRCFMGSRAFVTDCDGTAYPCFHRKDLDAGNVLRVAPSAVEKRLRSYGRRVVSAPCYGEHCVSLFCGER